MLGEDVLEEDAISRRILAVDDCMRTEDHLLFLFRSRAAVDISRAGRVMDDRVMDDAP